MNAPSIKVLIVEDEFAHARAICRALRHASPSIECQVVGTLGEYGSSVELFTPDLVLLDLNLPDGRAESLLRYPPESGAFPIVVMTSHGDEKTAVASIQQGAMDYVVKSPEAFADIAHTLDRVLRAWQPLKERQQALEQLRESEERFRTYIEQAAEAVFVHDAAGRFLEVNEQVCRSLGYRRDELLRMSVFDVDPEFNQTWVAVPWEKHRPGESIVLERYHRRKDGLVFPVEIRFGCFEIRGERRFLALVRDVTERKKQEEMDRLQLQVLHQLATGVPLREVLVSIVQLVELGRDDWFGSLMLVDESGARLNFGAAPRLPLFFRQAIDGVAIKPTSGSCGAAVATKQMVAIEDITTHRNWTRFRHEALKAGLRACWSLPILSPEGNALGALAVFHPRACLPQDEELRSIEKVVRLASIAISQRRSEDSLRKREAELEAAQALAHLGSWRLTLDPYRLSWSAETCRIFTRTCAPSSEVEFLACIHPDDRASVNKAWQDVWSGIPFDLEHRILAHGKTKWVRQLGVLEKDRQGEALQCMGTFLDVTALRETEVALRQAQKLEAIGQLAGGVAHDFNNILAAVMMQLSLLQMNPALKDEVRAVVNELEEEARRAASLTRQLLMFSRRAVLAVKPLDLDEVVDNLLKMLRRLIGEHIKLELGHRTSLPQVEADAGMMEQVLLNLVVNARDAIPKGGKITISTSVASFSESETPPGSYHRPGQFVCLTVSDTGCGMDADTLKRIFEPFFTTKEVGKGTGLGLATVHGIVAQHKGWVEVNSELGIGTIFKVYLPALARSPAEQASAKQKPQVPGGQETILVVEDQIKVRQLVALTLQAHGYAVYEAGNGQEAMKIWQQHGSRVDLLLTDMVMPEGLTGLELAERLRRLKPELKTIISSGYSAEIAQKSAIDKAGIVYLPKPYEGHVLAEVVRKCLDEK